MLFSLYICHLYGNLLSVATRKAHPDATDAEMEVNVKQYFRLASDRQGGRERRRKRKLEEEFANAI